MEEGRHILPACDKVCDEAVRELMLLAPFELEDPKTRDLLRLRGEAWITINHHMI